MPMLRFQLQGAAQEWELGSFSLTIGRHADNSIVLPDPQAAPHHAVIAYEQGRYYVEDLNSRSGTLVNGQQIGRVELCHDDRIRIASLELHFIEMPIVAAPIRSTARPTDRADAAAASRMLDELVGSIRQHRQHEQDKRQQHAQKLRDQWAQLLDLAEQLKAKIGANAYVRYFGIDRRADDVMIRVQRGTESTPQLITLALRHPRYPDTLSGIWLLRSGQADRCLPSAEEAMRELVRDLAFLLA